MIKCLFFTCTFIIQSLGGDWKNVYPCMQFKLVWPIIHYSVRAIAVSASRVRAPCPQYVRRLARVTLRALGRRDRSRVAPGRGGQWALSRSCTRGQSRRKNIRWKHYIHWLIFDISCLGLTASKLEGTCLWQVSLTSLSLFWKACGSPARQVVPPDNTGRAFLAKLVGQNEATWREWQSTWYKTTNSSIFPVFGQFLHFQIIGYESLSYCNKTF